MSRDNDVLRPEDYTDPVCPFCTEQFTGPEVRPIPTGRVLDKLDEHLARNDYESAERHLRYWLQEAVLGGDERGEFQMANELMGLCRKVGKGEDALAFAERALALADKLGIADQAAGGTALVNAATVCKAFGRPERALELFEKAEKVYLAALDAGDPRLGGLYNNWGLALVDLRRFAEAEACYAKALAVMERAENGALERAITLLNLADAKEAELGPEAAESETASLLDEAEGLMNDPSLPRNGYYAFVCEKCAGVFGYYGRFATQRELEGRAKAIYEGT